MFVYFEEEYLLSETRNDMESGNKFDDEPMSTDMLEDICYRKQYRPIISRR